MSFLSFTSSLVLRKRPDPIGLQLHHLIVGTTSVKTEVYLETPPPPPPEKIKLLYRFIESGPHVHFKPIFP